MSAFSLLFIKAISIAKHREHVCASIVRSTHFHMQKMSRGDVEYGRITNIDFFLSFSLLFNSTEVRSSISKFSRGDNVKTRKFQNTRQSALRWKDEIDANCNARLSLSRTGTMYSYFCPALRAASFRSYYSLAEYGGRILIKLPRGGNGRGVDSLFKYIRPVSVPERLDGLSFPPDIRSDCVRGA